MIKDLQLTKQRRWFLHGCLRKDYSYYLKFQKKASFENQRLNIRFFVLRRRQYSLLHTNFYSYNKFWTQQDCETGVVINLLLIKLLAMILSY